MMSEKKDFKATKFGRFLEKAKGVITNHGGDVLSIAATAVTNPVAAIQQVGDLLKKGDDADNESKTLLYEFERDKMEYQLELQKVNAELVKSYHNLEAVQLQQEDLWTKRARPTRQYFWLLAIILMIILDYKNVMEGKTHTFLTFDNPLLYIMAADFGYYQFNRSKEKMAGAAK